MGRRRGGSHRPLAVAVVNTWRWAAVVIWVYAAGFGLAAIPVAWFLLTRGRLPVVFGLFPAYGGPWSERLSQSTFVLLLGAFLLVTMVAALSGWLLWDGSRLGSTLALALIPVEAVFWYGFALPIPPLAALIRVVLIVMAWRSLN